MKKYFKQNFRRFFSGMMLAGLVIFAGCQTADQADSGDLASVQISGHTDAEIQQAATKVFLANGYQQDNSLTFEKQGGAWDKIAHGGWSSNPVWIKMRLNITSPEVGQSILGCNAFAIVDRDEPAMVEEKKLSLSYKSECVKILAQTKTMLASPTNSAQ